MPTVRYRDPWRRNRCPKPNMQDHPIRTPSSDGYMGTDLPAMRAVRVVRPRVDTGRRKVMAPRSRQGPRPGW